MAPKKNDKTKQDEDNGKDEVAAYYFPDGSRYDGQLLRRENGQLRRNGNGVFVDTCATYDGQWAEDEMCGEGSMEFDSGSNYVGEFLNNMFHGKGQYTWADGSYYSGYWRANHMHGEGVYSEANGRKWYGKFYDGEGQDLRVVDGI